MGAVLNAYGVDLDSLRAELGCGDAALADQLGTTFADRYDYLEDLLPEGVTLADIARHMIMGGPYDERAGAVYGGFVELLCARHGVILDWGSLNPPVPMDYVQAADRALGEAELLADGFSLQNLIFGGSPIAYPYSNESMAVGQWSAARADEPADLLASTPHSSLPEEWHGVAYELFQWLAYIRKTGRHLVTFYG